MSYKCSFIGFDYFWFNFDAFVKILGIQKSKMADHDVITTYY